MKTISKLVLKNFKFFHGEQTLNFNNKNIILYGENGSGKSSIYWALYTLLQSSIKKTDDEKARILKYFDKNDQDSLVNRYMNDRDTSLVAVKLNDDSKYITSIEATNTNLDEDTTIYESYITSDFINYKLLAKNFDLKHSENLDIFEFLENEILNDLLIKNKSKTYGKWLKQLSFGYMPTRSDNYYSSRTSLNSDLESFISELQEFLASITQDVNDILKKYFDLKFEISFEVENSGTTSNTQIMKLDGKEKRSTINSIYQPHVYMYLKNYDGTYIHKPHTFLNEAKQTAIALSIRFAILKSKATSEDTLKILVLDDLLVSLDMSNRNIVLNMLIKDEYMKDYQIIMLTHDRALFELAKYKFELQAKDKWEYFEMYENSSEEFPKPLVLPNQPKNYLEKAEAYFKLCDYPTAGNYLRKASENVMKDKLLDTYFREIEKPTLDPMIQMYKKMCTDFKIDVPDCILSLEQNAKRVFNPSSHDDLVSPLYKKEIEDSIKAVKEISELKNIEVIDASIKQGSLLKFEYENKYEVIYRFLGNIRLLAYDEQILNRENISMVKCSHRLLKDGNWEDENVVDTNFFALKKIFQRIKYFINEKFETQIDEDIFVNNLKIDDSLLCENMKKLIKKQCNHNSE